MNQGISVGLFVLQAGWLGEVNLRKSVARDLYRGTHVISLDYLPQT